MACTVRTRLSKLLRAFSHDQRGVFSVLLAVLAIPILSFVGLAIDYSRLTKLQANLQSMADSAALAAAVAIKSKPHAHFELHAHHFEKANKDFELSRINYSYTKDEVHHTVTAYLTTSVTNYFGIFLGKRHSPISARAVSSYDTVPPLEIAIAFDVTGSMKYRGDGDSGETVSVPKPDSKAVQAQKGLKKFIDKLTELTDVRAALVPFATVVKVDADSTRYQPWLDWKAGSVAHVEKKSDWEGCIVDRDPGVGPFVSQHTAHYPATTCQKDDWRAVHWTKSTLNNVVQSTDNLTMLKDRIGGLQFDGCTNQSVDPDPERARLRPHDQHGRRNHRHLRRHQGQGHRDLLGQCRERRSHGPSSLRKRPRPLFLRRQRRQDRQEARERDGRDQTTRHRSTRELTACDARAQTRPCVAVVSSRRTAGL
jgi:hypothetical protein